MPDPVLALAAPPPLPPTRRLDEGGGGYGGYGGYGYGAYGGYGGNVTDVAPGNSTSAGVGEAPAGEDYVTAPSGPTEPLPETLPYTFSFEFLGVDFATFVADPSRVATFKLDVRRRSNGGSSWGCWWLGGAPGPDACAAPGALTPGDDR